MRNLKKALSVFLCVAMIFTTLCFFPLDVMGVKADATVVNTGNRTALHVPETIYLYPDVTSWTSAVSSPFQYYVGNTVDTEDVYASPVADANLDTVGKIYFAAEEGMSDVELTVKFLDLQGVYMDEADYGTVEVSKTDKGDHYLFEVTGGTSPVLDASVNGAYIEWGVSYKNPQGETKTVFNYSYMYKPYVVPYGAAVRVYNEKDDVNVYGQQITWITGVHSIDNTASAKNTLYPYYLTLASGSSSRRSFSPFLSKGNKAYVGGVEVSGAAPVLNGGYNAVFSGTDESTAYFYAGQEGYELSSSSKVMNWFATASGTNTYPYGSFDYMNNATVSTQYALSQVTPTKLGSIRVDVSRYDNLNEIPNLAVGMMVTDVDYNDALSGSTAVPTAQWYVGDATGSTHSVTGAYDTLDALNSARNAVNNKFASETDITSPLSLGIKYAGAWDKDIDKSVSQKQYTAKAYYESLDREGDYLAASSAVSLNVTQVDKTGLRAAVNKATSYLGVLGVKSNWNSYYYDVNYIDPDTNNSAWERFKTAYIYAAGALTNVDLTFDVAAFTDELNAALDVLLAGEGLRVYFDVNHDDIGINLYIPSEEKVSSTGLSYTWDAENEAVVLDGSDAESGTYFSYTPFTPSKALSYVLSVEKISGSFTSQQGCTVIEPTDNSNNYSFANSDGTSTRYNFDNFTGGSNTRIITYGDEHYINIEKMLFRTWYNTSYEPTVADNFTVRIKFEQGTQKTEYSPAGKVVGTSYGTLPVPTREGYLFEGWCTDESLTTVVTADSAVSSRILYAKWGKAQYNVVFDGNGSTGGVMDEQTFTYDETGTLNENAYVRTGYVFNGWKDAEGNTYTDKAEVFNLTSEHLGNFTLYAQWTPNQYSVAFDGNTGLGGIGIINCVYDTPFELPANYFIKTGYTFIGWSDVAGGEVLYTDKETVSNLSSDENGSATLYAVWQANTFTVTFDKNTGDGEMANADVVYDSGVSLPDCGFTKTGYTFVGWSTSTDEADIITDIEYDNLKTEEGDSVTLYAIWSENTYTLSFDMNGGEGTKIEPTPYSYTANITLPKNVFTKKGHTLAGWALSPDGEAIYANGQTVSGLATENNASVVLYAVWTPVEYKVAFDAAQGEGTMDTVDAVYGTAFELPENTFSREGYHFMGWSLTDGGTVAFTDGEEVNNLTDTADKTVTLYAVWEINVYDVTFVYYIADGTQKKTTVQVSHGSAAQVPLDFVDYPRNNTTTHNVFSKWNVDFSSVTAPMTVTARYSVTAEAHEMQEKITPSTCTVKGSEVDYCVKCGYSVTTVLDFADHDLDDGVITTSPKCTEVGIKTFSCANCSYTTAESVPATGHSFVDIEARETSCKEKGCIAHKDCTACSNHFASDAAVDAPLTEALTDEEVYIDALPHTPGVEATCTEDQTCTVCFAILTSAFGHSESTSYITEDASCTVEGSYTEKVTCTVCKEEISSVSKTGKLPHSYEVTVVDPTCTEVGYTQYVCSVCLDTYKDDEIGSLGHTPSAEWVETDASTCVKKGTEVNYCAVCGDITETRELALAEHTEGDWVEKTPATCEGFGSEALECGVCGYAITTRAISPKGHGDTEEKVTVEPGCETAGKKSTLCLDCGKELSSVVIPETGHSEGAAATCETDQVCLNCNSILASAYGHKWDSGVVTKEATETEKGTITFTCANDESHKKYVDIPIRIVIALPELPEDGTYDLDADETGYAGNINDIITVEAGYSYTVSVSDSSLLTVSSDGTVKVLGDGEAVITVKTNDGKYEKTLPVALRTLKTVEFVANNETVSTLKAYIGDVLAGPTVQDYEDENGFVHSFKAWSVDGVETAECLVTGDMTFVAVFTASCDYTELDRLSAVFDDVLSGNYDNSSEILVNSEAIENMKAAIEKYSQNRETRDISEQAAIDSTVSELSGLISKLYPEENATLEIRDFENINAGASRELKVYKLPVGTRVTDVIFTSSDNSIGFFLNGIFCAVKAGTVTVTASSGNLTVSQDITVAPATNARVIMFDTLLSNVNYIVERTYVIETTTNMFWATDAPVTFSLIADGTFEDYVVYFNDVEVQPDANGCYTIPANIGDVHVRAEGLVKDLTDPSGNGETLSFWEMLLKFFRSIGDFFRNLFSF